MIEVQIRQKCPICDGRGWKLWHGTGWWARHTHGWCATCDGTGRERRWISLERAVQFAHEEEAQRLEKAKGLTNAHKR